MLNIFKGKTRFRLGLPIVLLAAGMFCACSSNKGAAAMSRTPDFCNSAENRTVPKVDKKSAPQPGRDTPIGGDYRERRR